MPRQTNKKPQATSSSPGNRATRGGRQMADHSDRVRCGFHSHQLTVKGTAHGNKHIQARRQRQSFCLGVCQGIGSISLRMRKGVQLHRRLAGESRAGRRHDSQGSFLPELLEAGCSASGSLLDRGLRSSFGADPRIAPLTCMQSATTIIPASLTSIECSRWKTTGELRSSIATSYYARSALPRVIYRSGRQGIPGIWVKVRPQHMRRHPPFGSDAHRDNPLRGNSINAPFPDCLARNTERSSGLCLRSKYMENFHGQSFCNR